MKPFVGRFLMFLYIDMLYLEQNYGLLFALADLLAPRKIEMQNGIRNHKFRQEEHNNQLGKSECSWKQSGRGEKNLMFLPTLSELIQPNPYQRSRISPDMINFFVAHLFILCF